jgi:acyl-CoA synthetase (AMP-forming)/AMP-acid ligase II
MMPEEGTLTRGLAEAARAYPDHYALGQAAKEPISYTDLWERVQRVSGGLQAEGLEPGDGVLFSVRPGVDSLVLILAIARCGGIIVFADPGMGPDLFAERMGTVTVSWAMAESMLYMASSRGPVRWIVRQRTGLRLPYLTDLPVRHLRVGRRWPGVPRSLSLSRLQRTPVGAFSVTTPIPDDADALIVFTSGTTARPRAIAHDRAGLAATIARLRQLIDITPDDTLYTDELHSIIPALESGARVIFPSVAARSVAGRLREIHETQPSHLFMVPSEMQALVDNCKSRDRYLPESLRGIVLGSAPIGKGLLEAIRAIAPPDVAIWCVYAMTEMVPVCMIDAEEKLRYDGPGDIVGVPAPGVVLEVSEAGEIVVSGPHLRRYVVGEPPSPLHQTGDRGFIDDDGRLVLTGRCKDMIIRGRYNIYPGLYEPTILRIPGVRDCALVGIRDTANEDERVVLVVDPEAGENVTDMPQRVAARLRSGPNAIDNTAWPDEIVTAELPRSGRSHKLDRAALRERVAELLACE